MKESTIVERLEKMDRELHSLLTEFRAKPETLSLDELNKVMQEDRISDKDSTELIREMRQRSYE